MLSSRRRGDGVEVTIPPWRAKFGFYAGRRIYFGRLEARDDLGALVRQAGEGARVHRRLRQRCRGVASSLYEEHLWESESLIACLRSRRRRELNFFMQLPLGPSVAPQTAVWRRRSIRLCIHFEEQVTQPSRTSFLSSEALTPEHASSTRPGALSMRATGAERSGLITTETRQPCHRSAAVLNPTCLTV